MDVEPWSFKAMQNNELAKWVGALFGPETPYRSIRALSLAAGLDRNTVNNVYVKGRGLPLTLIKLARTTGSNPVQAFVKAGWITQEEALRQFDATVVEAVARLNEMSEYHRRVVLADIESYSHATD